jgi:uncharacterized membrane protein (UPF0127 family)
MASSSISQPRPLTQRFALVAIILVVVAGAALAWALLSTSDAADDSCPGDECITVHTGTGAYLFTVEWAVEGPERNCGLMFRPEMAADHGMVFDFQTERQVSFWMHNTLIPLDMVFIRESGEVLNIAKHTIPLTDTGVPAAGPVRYVLEVNAGTADRIGLAPGDLIDLARADGRTEGTAVCYTVP